MDKSPIDHPSGNYRFLPGIAPYSRGVCSQPGFEIVYVTLRQPTEYRRGFERIASFLQSIERPKAALCGISLRSPRPYSFAGFNEFNQAYTEILKEWGVFVRGVNPVARTNVAPVVCPPKETVLYGFAFTRPCADDLPATCLVAGAGELPEGRLSRESIVALGDISMAGLTTKAQFVMDLMDDRLRCMGFDWRMVSAANVYTVHSLSGLLPEIILGRIGSAAIHGVHWHYSRPPIEEIEFEMDVRVMQTEMAC